jgi:phenylacetate-CoA ligase
VSNYSDAAAASRLEHEYPVGADFLDTYVGMSRDALRAEQERRFRRVMDTAWQTPFYVEHWSRHGVEPGDVTCLDDLDRLPLVDKSHLMADMAAHPPFGTLGRRLDGRVRPQVLQTTSGTTGNPQPVLWGAWGREVQNALLGRTYQWVGVGADDVVHSVYGHGPVNGGHYVREALVRYTDALLLSAGTGTETRSERQVAMMAHFQPTVLVGFADYLRRLAAVAREAGLEPGVDIPVRLVVGHLPMGSREQVEQDWPGSRAYDWYGIADTGIVAAEGPERDGQWLWEDANVIEVLDPQTARPLPDGEEGELVITSLGKDDVAPLVRFSSHDVTRILPGPGAHDLPFRRMAGLLGRSDQMVKLRGINVYPTAVASLITGVPGATGEYYCRLERRPDGAEHLVVVVEASGTTSASDVGEELTRALGVKVGAEVVPPGSTATTTGLTTRQKPLRLVDVR